MMSDIPDGFPRDAAPARWCTKFGRLKKAKITSESFHDMSLPLTGTGPLIGGSAAGHHGKKMVKSMG
jgi:hypothetical protein